MRNGTEWQKKGLSLVIWLSLSFFSVSPQWQHSLNTGYRVLGSCVKMHVVFSALYFNNFIFILALCVSPSKFLNWSVIPQHFSSQFQNEIKSYNGQRRNQHFFLSILLPQLLHQNKVLNVSDWLMYQGLSGLNEESDPFREVNWRCKRHPHSPTDGGTLRKFWVN